MISNENCVIVLFIIKRSVSTIYNCGGPPPPHRSNNILTLYLLFINEQSCLIYLPYYLLFVCLVDLPYFIYYIAYRITFECFVMTSADEYIDSYSPWSGRAGQPLYGPLRPALLRVYKQRLFVIEVSYAQDRAESTHRNFLLKRFIIYIYIYIYLLLHVYYTSLFY